MIASGPDFERSVRLDQRVGACTGWMPALVRGTGELSSSSVPHYVSVLSETSIDRYKPSDIFVFSGQTRV